MEKKQEENVAKIRSYITQLSGADESKESMLQFEKEIQRLNQEEEKKANAEIKAKEEQILSEAKAKAAKMLEKPEQQKEELKSIVAAEV